VAFTQELWIVSCVVMMVIDDDDDDDGYDHVYN